MTRCYNHFLNKYIMCTLENIQLFVLGSGIEPICGTLQPNAQPSDERGKGYQVISSSCSLCVKGM